MDASADGTEQRQLLVEIDAVTASIGRQRDPERTSFEVEQGRKLIEKAIGLGIPEASYAKLKGQVEAHDGGIDRP